MPRLRRRALWALPWLWAARPAAAEGLTLEGLMAQMAAAPARQAAFSETRRFAALDAPLESRGWLAYRPGYLEKVTTWPVAERLEVAGDRIVVTEGNEAPRVIDLAYVPALRVLIDAIRGPLSGDAGAVRRAFWPALTDASTGGAPGAWALTLVPRAAAAVRSVRLEGVGDAVRRIRIAQGNGDEQVMVIGGG